VKSRTNIKQMLGGNPKPVGGTPGDVSPYGVYDLCGNAAEWTASNFQPYKGNTEPNESYGDKNRVVRGGSFNQSDSMAELVRRDWMAPDDARVDVGFRCAK